MPLPALTSEIGYVYRYVLGMAGASVIVTLMRVAQESGRLDINDAQLILSLKLLTIIWASKLLRALVSPDPPGWMSGLFAGGWSVLLLLSPVTYVVAPWTLGLRVAAGSVLFVSIQWGLQRILVAVGDQPDEDDERPGGMSVMTSSWLMALFVVPLYAAIAFFPLTRPVHGVPVLCAHVAFPTFPATSTVDVVAEGFDLMMEHVLGKERLLLRMGAILTVLAFAAEIAFYLVLLIVRCVLPAGAFLVLRKGVIPVEWAVTLLSALAELPMFYAIGGHVLSQYDVPYVRGLFTTATVVDTSVDLLQLLFPFVERGIAFALDVAPHEAMAALEPVACQLARLIH